jgi:hypothetical protein
VKRSIQIKYLTHFIIFVLNVFVFGSTWYRLFMPDNISYLSRNQLLKMIYESASMNWMKT